MATKKRYNFKGLDEIFGESVTDLVGSLEDNTEKAKELASTVAISTLQPNPFQPRKIFSDVEIQELSDSIKQNGIIQPIIVNEVAKNSYQIVAGERRYRAAKLANLKEVPVVIAKLDSKQMEEFAIIENIQRVDLTDIEEAVAYKQLAKSLNLKQDEIAKRVGKSRSHVANILRLVNLPQYIQDAMLQKEISMGQAKPLLSILSNEKLLKEVFDRIVANNLTARDVEQLIKKLQSGDDVTTKVIKKRDPLLNGIENKLMIRFGTRVSISDNKIVLKYNGVEDLNKILELMGYESED
jgi:ParB family chromosome partitioning protein